MSAVVVVEVLDSIEVKWDKLTLFVLYLDKALDKESRVFNEARVKSCYIRARGYRIKV
jgi:hypothetical protein